MGNDMYATWNVRAYPWAYTLIELRQEILLGNIYVNVYLSSVFVCTISIVVV